ncbi:MAG TPA: DUF309 domain-containing protein [Candidatus Nitrosocosmicus sp.]|nr:DUF309 domain-containing protein [Candidatus Nitrosocosmicus sp.]
MKNRYLVYLDNKNNYLPTNSGSVLYSLRMLLQNYNHAVVRDIRISSYFIEIDVSTQDNTSLSADDLNFFEPINILGSLIRLEELNEVTDFISPEDAVMSAVFLFNMERYWKSHEVLESVWKNSKGQTKNLLNGLILVDAAYVHLQKGENTIFFSILNRSLEKFKDYSEYFYDINMEILLKDIHKMIQTEKASIIKMYLK